MRSISKGSFERSENPKGAQAAARASRADKPRRAHSKVQSAATIAPDSRAERFWARRIRQDFDPKTYLCMSSGRKDAVAAGSDIVSTVGANVAAH